MLDNAGGVAQATERLIDLGHTQVVFVSGPDHASVVERRTGYIEAMRKHGLPTQVIYVGELGIGEGDGAAEEIAKNLPSTTAVICSNDMQAFGVLRRLAQLGYQIPGDISVVGFDDVSMATLTFPSLTTVHVDRIAFGRLAVELLMSRVQSPGRPPVRCTMAVNMVERCVGSGAAAACSCSNPGGYLSQGHAYLSQPPPDLSRFSRHHHRRRALARLPNQSQRLLA